MASKVGAQVAVSELPAVPLTLEGYSVLHQMFRFRWTEWRKLDEARPARKPGSSPPIRCWATRAT
jgi:hypothetical protein